MTMMKLMTLVMGFVTVAWACGISVVDEIGVTAGDVAQGAVAYVDNLLTR